jgi:transposase
MTRRELESRRVKAAVLFSLGWIPSAVARELGVSRMSACRWRATFQRGQSMRQRRASGRPPRLSAEQLRQLPALYHSAGEPNAAGFRAILAERTGVQFNRDHVGRLLKKLGIKLRRGRPKGGHNTTLVMPSPVERDEAIAS